MKKTISKAICLFAAALYLAVCIMPCALASNTIIDNARRSVVRVWVQVEGGNYYGSVTGTAFIVAQEGTTTVLVTNLHVVSGMWYYDYYEDDYIYLAPVKVWIIPDDLSGKWYEPQVTYLQDDLDLAILTTSVGLSGRDPLPLVDVRDIHAADVVYALGFPGAADQLIDNNDALPSSADDVTVTRGIVSKASVPVLGTDAFQTDCYINHGNSGGPMLNETGGVLGVNTWGSDGVNYVIHVSYVVDAMNEMGIKYTPWRAGSSANTNTGDDEDEDTPSRGRDRDTEPASGSKSIGDLFADYWWVLLIVVVLICAVVVIIKMRKPAPVVQPVAQPAPIPATAPAPPSASSHLVCTKGHFAGTTFPINGSLSIGRDPSKCQIVFPGDTKGISSLHCEVRQQASGVTLTDKGSTYGTFLAGGRKLNSGESVPLAPGNSFYLADNANEFKVL